MKNALSLFRVFHLALILTFSSNGFSQSSEIIPLKHFAFDTVDVLDLSPIDTLYYQSARFTGHGEIVIYDDSIYLSWSNEWECGHYSMSIDTAVYEQFELGNRAGWNSIYYVTTKGYHDVSGILTLREGTDLYYGWFVDVTLDTSFDESGYATKRRIYWDLSALD